MVKKITIILFNICLAAGAGYAQEKKSEIFARSYDFNSDTLLQQIPETREGVDSLLTITGLNLSKNLNKSLAYAMQTLQMAKPLKYTEGIARARYFLGIASLRLGKYAQSMQHLLKARELTKEIDDKEFIANVLNVMANFYFYRKNYDKAAVYYKKAIAKQLETGDNKQSPTTTMNLGVVYYYQGEYQKSLKKYRQVFKYLDEDDADNNQYLRMVTRSNMGNLFIGMRKHREAENNLLKANAYFSAHGYTMNQAVSFIYLAELYHQMESTKALDYAEEGIKKAKSIGYKFFVMKGYKLLAYIYERQNNYQKAFNTFRQYKNIQDSLLSNEMDTKIQVMRTRLDIKNKNEKIELLQKQAELKEAKIKQQNLWNIFIAIALTLSLIIVGLLYRYNKKGKQINFMLEEKNQKIIHQNKKLNELDKEKDEFLGIVAHDLRSPLTGIVSAVDLLKTDNLSKAEVQEYNEIISISAGRMLGLIDRLLNINEEESRLDNINITKVSLQKTIDEVVENYKKHAQQKGIALIWNGLANKKKVKADKEALRRILDNLISNALKYSPSGSTVKITTASREKMIKISVKDNGPGINLEEQKKLFKRYNRLSTEPTADEGSTGLGLFIVKKLTENMNGTVECKSKPGEGAEFIVYLPAGQGKIINI